MALIVIIIAVLIIFKLSFVNWLSESNSIHQERVVTDSGDEFILNIESRTFPDIDTAVTVMDSEGKEQIAYIVVDGQSYKSDFITLVNSQQIVCYQFYSELIYKSNNKFKSLNVQLIEEATPKEQPQFISVAKALVETKEWKWIKICSRFLLKAGDNGLNDMLKRYAAGQFTQEEIDINKDSEVSAEDIQSFCKEILD